MAADIQSSFIPKQVLTKEPRPRREPLGLFFLLSLVVLFIILLFFAGAYVYRTTLESDINRACPSANPGAIEGCGLVASIEARRQSLDQTLILKIERLDKLLKRAASILDNHRTLLPVFRFLEAETLQTIRYSSFGQTGSSLNLRGSARNYEGIALQSIIFAGNSRVKDFVFSDLNADAGGRVSFSLKLEVDPKLLNYFDDLLSSPS
ncbi:MAG: hypothetical protein HY481_01715 [Candidatus Vogelbacteria bacterium]|nr:hypothetical protein [Candidatus Vogelbacteria bacterium]